MDAIGKEKTKPVFPIDYVHSSSEGAELNARDVVIALEIADSPLVKYLKAAVPIPPDAVTATTASASAMAAAVPAASAQAPPAPAK